MNVSEISCGYSEPAEALNSTSNSLSRLECLQNAENSSSSLTSSTQPPLGDFITVIYTDEYGDFDQQITFWNEAASKLESVSFSMLILRLAITANILSIVFNGTIFLVLLFVEKLRTAQLLPVMFQSVLDLLFTGVVPLFANTLGYWLYTNTARVEKLHDIFFDDGGPELMRALICKIFIFCDAIVKGSTGLNICVLALFRYICVCHPFEMERLNVMANVHTSATEMLFPESEAKENRSKTISNKSRLSQVGTKAQKAQSFQNMLKAFSRNISRR